MRQIYTPVLMLTLAAIVAGCAPAPSAGGAGPELRQVSMRLQWFPQYQFAGYIVAKVKGYYEQAGLDVTLNPGGPDLVSLPLVATGKDTFGSTGADTVLTAREQDIDVVALATWFQASPVTFMVHSDSGIIGPQDFPGHTVGMFYGDNVETEYLALLAATGVERAAITEIPGDFSLAPFLERRADIWPVYATDQPNTARREGANISLIFARDYGVQLMGDVLFTSAAFAKQNPNTVRAFVEATLRGWQDAIDNPAETVDLIAAYNPDLEKGQLSFEAEETIKLITYGAGKACPGSSDPAAWEAEAMTLRNLAILAKPADLTAAVDNQYVAGYYQGKGVACGITEPLSR
ncbi:ABC transporter substrate-binding protein [Oscillochloris sp. ZM17-4]|uniref:ABC transporter substrate-binding protein n=1 Tax=Oscillochloris sp. ZM17-4 TaxID=2866714 RepID=UPI001C72A51F|nr:ABC transporter substrate-binding protein [Oscillochloris sp. ZM17-4]MBX0327239.1 ABC transporter substrate-binding protein [Oscillochloris sp. ZM17-4]